MEQQNMNNAFTRYLYFKKEVEISLVTCILEKKNEAEFWAYELFYSGYQQETLNLLWKIYYNFFATLNPSFEAYFMKKQKETMDHDDTIIATIVNNLIIRPFNLDVFLLHKINTHLDIEDEEEENQSINLWEKYVEHKDFLNITKLILLDCSSLKTLNKLSECCSVDKDKIITQTKSWQKIINHHSDQSMTPIILISKLMGFFTKQEQKPKGKNFYVIIEPSMIEKYKTIAHLPTTNAYKILPQVCQYSIDPSHYLSLFEIPRHAEQKPMDMYHYKWLYYASFSPVWASRIQEYHGFINHPKKAIEFGTEDNMELFYEKYGYEPDEQKIEIQHRNVQPIQNVRTWQTVYDQYVEEGIVRISSDIMEALDRIRF